MLVFKNVMKKLILYPRLTYYLGCDLKRLWEILRDEGGHACDLTAQVYLWKFLRLQPSLDILISETSHKRKKDVLEGWKRCTSEERCRLSLEDVERRYANKLKMVATSERRRQALYDDLDVSKPYLLLPSRPC